MHVSVPVIVSVSRGAMIRAAVPQPMPCQRVVVRIVAQASFVVQVTFPVQSRDRRVGETLLTLQVFKRQLIFQQMFNQTFDLFLLAIESALLFALCFNVLSKLNLLLRLKCLSQLLSRLFLFVLRWLVILLVLLGDRVADRWSGAGVDR